MSLTTQISIESDTATPMIENLSRQITPNRMAAAIGPRATRLVQRNFRSLGANEKGWPSTHFYARAAESTNWQEGTGFVEISVSQIGIRQRLMGGAIRPVNAGALTIPAQPDAYGKTAGEFQNLQFKFVLDPERGVMRPALVEKAGQVKTKTGRKKKDGSQTTTEVSATTGLVALFWLSKGVKQDPDPKVMPSDREFDQVFDQSVQALTGD